VPFPQTSRERQSALQPSPLVTLPSSHSSPALITPSPQPPRFTQIGCIGAQTSPSLQRMSYCSHSVVRVLNTHDMPALVTSAAASAAAIHPARS